MPETKKSSASPRPRCRETEEQHYRYSSLWNHEQEWLPWQSNGQGHGLKQHRVTGGGHVEEAVDHNQQPQKKIKGISSRQWARR